MVMLGGRLFGLSKIYSLVEATFLAFCTSERQETNPGPSYKGSCCASSAKPMLVLKVMVGFGFVPFLVVISTTPAADLAPNTAAELASFSTSMVAISLGLMSLSCPG